MLYNNVRINRWVVCGRSWMTRNGYKCCIDNDDDDKVKKNKGMKKLEKIKVW